MSDCSQGDSIAPGSPGGELANGGTSFERGALPVPHAPLNLTASKCSASTAVARVQQGQAVDLILQVRDFNGEAVPLNTPAATPDPGSSSSSSSSPIAARVRLVAKHYTGDVAPVFDVTGAIEPGTIGHVRFSLTPANLAASGMFACQLLVQATDSDALYWATNYWLQVAPSAHLQSRTTLTIGEMRLFLHDECGEQNTLLGDFEFNDSEIANAIHEPIDQFNATNFPITRYTTTTFPREWRFWWKRAAAGHLLRSAARFYLREQLPYTAGDVRIDDKNKYEQYHKMADVLLEEWEKFIVRTKSQLNLGRAWGSLRSPYLLRR